MPFFGLLSLFFILPTVHSFDVTLSTPGIYTVIIPSTVTDVIVDLWGAGGSGSGYKGTGKQVFSGGSGSYVHCQLNLASVGGTTMTVIVGQGGQAPAYGTDNGINAIGGGGRGRNVQLSSLYTSGGGGGRSAIKNPSNVASDLVTAGGAGGGGMKLI